MRGLKAALFALVWFSCVWFGSWAFNPNTAIRLFAATSLVEDGDATVDDFADLTIDKAMFGGHFYLDKAPGMTLMALPAVAGANAVTGERSTAMVKLSGHPDITRFMTLRLLLAVASGPAVLTALAAVLLLDMGAALTGSVAAGLFAALGFALGTPVWGWSTTLFGHAPVAALYVIALWGALRGSRAGALLTGLALGWAAVVEYQAVLAGSVIAAWALWRWRARAAPAAHAGLALAGGLAALAPLFAYNLLAFGTPFRIGYSGVVGWEGMHRGLFGLSWPRPQVLAAVTVGLRHGLVWVAPILLLAPLGLSLWWDRRDRRAIAVLIAAVATVVLLVNAAYVYWEGGNSTGPRLAVPLVGVLALALAPGWIALPAGGARIAAASLLALSIAINAAIASADIFAPPNSAFPLWSDVVAGHFAAGDLRTLASDFGGWSPWAGFAMWAAIALPLLGRLAWAAGGAYPDHGRVTGA